MATTLNKYIPEVVKWMREHPIHTWEEGETLEYDSPAEMWLRFCADPTIINEYDDPEDYFMMGQKTKNGCTFVFSNGALRQHHCEVECVEGSRCKFHSHVIFSAELRMAITAYHAEIDQLCQPRATPAPSRQVTPAEPPEQVNVAPYDGARGYYREVTHNLIVHQCLDWSIECVGYLKNGTLSALTPELEEWCQKRKVTVSSPAGIVNSPAPKPDPSLPVIGK